MKTIPLTRGKFALVDDSDYEELSQYKWFAYKHRNTYYAARTVYLGGGRKHKKNRTIHMHREILNPAPGMETDHRNCNGLDNKRENLRVATRAQNSRNGISRRGTSRFKGVSWFKRDAKWYAYICISQKTTYLGCFDIEENAARAYDRAAIKYFGEFARLNFTRSDYD